MDRDAPESPLWRRTRRVTAVLLAAWLGVTFGLIFFAPSLEFRVFGWPFNFWAAAQGGMLFYLALVVFYAWWMERLEDEAAGGAEGGGGG